MILYFCPRLSPQASYRAHLRHVLWNSAHRVSAPIKPIAPEPIDAPHTADDARHLRHRSVRRARAPAKQPSEHGGRLEHPVPLNRAETVAVDQWGRGGTHGMWHVWGGNREGRWGERDSPDATSSGRMRVDVFQEEVDMSDWGRGGREGEGCGGGRGGVRVWGGGGVG